MGYDDADNEEGTALLSKPDNYDRTDSRVGTGDNFALEEEKALMAKSQKLKEQRE